MKTLAIIGGGAAGLAAAVAAAHERGRLRQDGSQGAEGIGIVVYESDDRVGRSILATGNGRCNFSNQNIDAAVYRNGAFVSESLLELTRQHARRRGRLTARMLEEDPVRSFLADLGLEWREEREGRLYPFANKASSVLDVLRFAAGDVGVREACGRSAVRIDAPGQEGERFHVRFSDGSIEHADAVVVATGGHSSKGIQLPGNMACEPFRPVLGPLRTDARVTRQLNNIRVHCAVELRSAAGKRTAREKGEVLFRDYGVSGVAVFNLSRFAQEGDSLSVDFMPDVKACDAEDALYRRRKRMMGEGTLSGERFLSGLLLPPVARVVLGEAGLRPEEPFEKSDVPPLARVLKDLRLTVLGMGDTRQCQVMRGGSNVEGFDSRTMEAHGRPRLYVVGEALDVDAPCGGYNLHWAWTSGILAGRAAVERLIHA